MRNRDDLRRTLLRIDGRGYKAYKDIEEEYDFGDYQLHIDRAQGDPFASPSRARIRLRQEVARFPSDTFKNKSREIALRDYITRAFQSACIKYGRGVRGTGNSGVIAIDAPGQEILQRTSVFVTESSIETRFVVGLPAFGRKIAGRQAESMFFSEIPRIVKASLYYKNLDIESLLLHLETAEDADFLRKKLEEIFLYNLLLCFSNL